MPDPTKCIMDAGRLAAPREHLGLLVEPDAAGIHACLTQDTTARYHDVPILDTTLGRLRARLRRRLELVGPVILTGHQAGFGHAGVFAKTIAADALAAATGGETVFLTVDSDVPKSQQLAIPCVAGDQLKRAFVDVPGNDARLPSEWLPEVGPEEWAAFFARIRSLWSGADDSLLPTFADGWLAAARTSPGFCDGMIAAHAAVESTLGLGQARSVRASYLCTTPEFRAFVAHLALHAPSFAAHYNQAQLTYRQRYRVRNVHRPAPLLHAEAERVELPFWVARHGHPRRRLHVADRGDAAEFFAHQEQIGTLPKKHLAQAEYHEDLWPLEKEGWHLRLRALSLSGFARLFLADVFIHGIGGAKYDRMTEDLVRRFFGVEPAPMCCVSATLYLPLPRHGVSRADVRDARQRSRDARYNLQRYLCDLPSELLRSREQSIAVATELRANAPHDRARRREAFERIRQANRELLTADPARVAKLDRDMVQLERLWRQDLVALDREYFFALHRRADLEQLVERVRARLGGDRDG